MLNSTIVSNIPGALPPSQKVSSGLRSSLLEPVDFTMTDVKTNSVSNNEQRKFLQKSGGRSSNAIFNGQRAKASNYLDHNKNPQVKLQMVNGNKNANEADEGIPSPKVCLYSGKISSEWLKVHKIGAGLINLGNTCFMNTVLQCLTYTPPLANYLLHDSDHTSKCKLAGFCMMCELQQHMKKAVDRPGDVIKPLHIYQKLKSIAKHFQFGRQEDAHEFLRYVIDNLWKSCLSNYEGHTKLDPASKETTVINQIFGGYHRSQVICLRCREKSNTYDHFMDFILDVKQNVLTLEKALEKFIQPELLQNENAYKCPQCKMKVSAQKKFSVYKAPNVATFQFKRFDYHRMCGGKITKHIAYPENLNLRPYMSVSKGSPVWYRLNAVLVHLGATCNSGHYFCYVRNSNGFWYLMDDARVQQVSLNQVLNQIAYVLFYVRVNSENMSTKRPAENAASSMKNNHMIKNGFIERANNASLHAPVPQSSLSLKPSPLPGISKLSVSQQKSSSNLCNGTSSNTNSKVLQPLSQNREKISFSVLSSDNANRLFPDSSKSEPPPRAVQSTSTTNKSVLNGNLLVPYIEDSSDSDDAKNENVSFKKKNSHAVSSPARTQSSVNLNTGVSQKQAASCHSENNENLVIECKAKSRCVSKQSFNYSSLYRGVASSPLERKQYHQNLNVATTSGGLTKREAKADLDLSLKSLKNDTSVSEKRVLHARENTSGESANKTSVEDTSATQSLESGANFTSTTKVNATSQWTATDISLHSPSVASGSSTNSVNSTTDWNVTEESGTRKKDRSSLAWNSRPVDRVYKSQKSEGSSAAVQAPEEMFSRVRQVSEGIAAGETMRSCFAGALECIKPKESATILRKASESIKGSFTSTESSSPGIPQDDKQEKKLKSRESSASSSRDDRPPERKNEHLSVAGKLLSPDEDSIHIFQDQPFHCSREDSFLGPGKGGSKPSAEHEGSEAREQASCERSISHVAENVGEKRTSRFLDSHENSNGPLPKKLKTDHNRVKDERKHSPVKNLLQEQPSKKISATDKEPNRDSVNVKTDSVTYSSNRETERDVVSRKQTKTSSSSDRKHSPHKHRTQKSPRKADSDSESIRSDKSTGRVSSSSSSVEYEWVEKTKETMSATQASGSDHDISKSSSKKHSDRSDKEGHHSSLERLHGSSRDNTNYKRGSSYLFGTDVGTWDGSSREDSRISESRYKRYFDEYDDELDKGKIRQKKKHHYRSSYDHNPFQEFSKNRNKSEFHGAWRPKPYNHRSYSHSYRKDRYYNRYNRSGFKYFPRMHNSDHRNFRHH